MVRRWDLLGCIVGFGVAAMDLGMFAWSGLEVTSLAQSSVGLSVLGGFTLGYGAFGFVCGRLYMARLRSLADADRIAAQLAELDDGRVRLAQSEKLAALGRLAAGIAHEVRNPLPPQPTSMPLDSIASFAARSSTGPSVVGPSRRRAGLANASSAPIKPSRRSISSVINSQAR